MANIEIRSVESGNIIQNTSESVVSLNQSSIVKINLNTEEVASIVRQGDAAVITLKNGEIITIENYFNYPIETSQILFENEGELIWAQFTDATGAVLDSVNYIPLNEAALIAGESVAGAALSPWLIGAGLAAGLGGAIAAVQDDSGSKNSKDTTAPDAPTAIDVSQNGLEVTGKAEPNSIITIKDRNGNVIGTGQTDADGNFKVILSNPLKDNDEIQVTATDAANNESDPTKYIVDLGNIDTDAAEKLVTEAETAQQVAEGLLAELQKDGLITPEERQQIQDAADAAAEAKNAAQDAVTALPDSAAKDGLQDRLDAINDPITVPAVNDADGNGVVDDIAAAVADAEDAVQNAENLYEAAETALSNADTDGNGLITPEEQQTVQDAIDAAQAAKDAAQIKVNAVPEDAGKADFQERLDALEPITVPEVTDSNGNGIDDADTAAEAAAELVTEAETAQQAAENLLAELQKDGLITPEERQQIQDAADAAAEAKNAAQDAVTALPDSAAKDGLQDRLDAINDPIIVPAVSFAYDDDINLDMGNEISITNPEVVDENVQVINLLESTGGIDAGTEVVLSGSINSLAISISQTSLLAVADAYRVDVLDGNGNIVYSAVTPNSQLVGDVAGLGILGIAGNNNTLTATVSDLPAGTYRVVVSNNASVLTNLLDTDGGGISLQELGDAGVLLGADNQEIILEAVSNALGGGAIAGLVTDIVLPPVLQLVNGLPADELVSALNKSLLSNANAISLLGFSVTGLLNTIIDATATALLSNTLTLLQETSITTQVTSTTFEKNTVGDNVLDNDDSSTSATVTKIQFGGSAAQEVTADGVSINGEYGVLTIYADGSYAYVGNGELKSIGKSEVFTYSVLNEDGVTDTATLTINILDRYAPDAPIVNPINNVNNITGTAEAGSTVIVTTESGNEIGRAVAGGDGLWSIPNPGLTSGTILNAVTIDLAGNSSQTVSTSVDAQAPIVTLVTNTTGDSTPILQGTIDDPTATIVVTVDGINYAAVNNGDGTWTLADGQLPELADGSYNVTVQALDVAGNKSTLTESLVVEAVLFANDDLNNVNVLDSVLEGNLNGVNGYTFGLLSTDVLSGVVDVNIATNGFRFTVIGDTTQDISIDVSGTTGVDVSIGLVTYANLLLINIDTGEIVSRVQNGLKLEPWVLTTRLVANNVEFTNIPEGNYTIGFSSTSVDGFLNSLLEGVVDLNLLSASRITINDSTQYSTADAIGNVLAGGAGTDIADIGDGMRVTEVISAETTYAVNTPIANIGETAIAGSHGILYMQADGSYRYVSNGDAKDVAKVDTFTYTVADAAGNTSQAYLNIRTDAEGATIVWNENDLQADGVITVNALDDDTTVSIAQTNSISGLLSKIETPETAATLTLRNVTSETSGGPIPVTTYTATMSNTYTSSNEFTVSENTIANGRLNIVAKLNDGALGLGLVDDTWGQVIATYQVLDADGNSVTGLNGDLTVVDGGLGTDTYEASVELPNLQAGTYTLAINVINLTTDRGLTQTLLASNNGEFTVETTLSVIETSLNDFTTIEGIYSEEGNLLEDDIISNIATFTIQQGAEIYHFENGHIYQNDVLLQNQNSVNITGTYGILNIEASGKYTYTTQDGNSIGQTESFTYTVNDVSGLSDTANLNIGIGASITGSRYDDSYSSHVGVADTVIYNVLEGAETDATGGNGTDIWTDFNIDEGDQIDISALLQDQDVSASTLSNYVTLEQRGDDTVVTIDRDGSATDITYAKTDLIILENTTAANLALDDLIKYNQI
ncbi:Ig-like domain-containing protein [Acinetobacter pseudolwoffii]|uniref:GA-like domain-containing protein n=1 Tax=Acinetobacter pseudolwoffii TaxID=2053287 RepID=UPI00360A41BD